MKKIKLTRNLLIQITELCNSDDPSNTIIAFGILNNINWNFKSKRHIFYIEMLWFGYLGSFREETDPDYKLERTFAKTVVKKTGCKLHTFDSKPIPDHYRVTEDLEKKYLSWGKKYDPLNYERICRNL